MEKRIEELARDLFEDAEESYESFKKWCKDNKKNPAFTKNMIEYLLLEKDDEEASPKNPKVSLQSLCTEDGNANIEDEFDSIICFLANNKEDGAEVRAMLVGNHRQELLLNNIAMLIRLAYGQQPKQKQLSERQLDLLNSALEVLALVL